MVKVVIVIVSTIVVPIVSETEVGECQDQEGEDEVHNSLIVFVVVLSHYKGMKHFSFHQIFWRFLFFLLDEDFCMAVVLVSILLFSLARFFCFPLTLQR